MNYIKEINGFYQRMETNPLSAQAANLWHTLMHVNNRAGWRTTFTVAMSVLCAKSGLSSSAFKRARTELRNKGYIRVQSRRGNQSAIYEMVSVDCSLESGEDEVTHSGKASAPAEGLNEQLGLLSEEQTNMDHKVDPLVKQKDTKQKISTTAAASVTFFVENFGNIKPYIQAGIEEWVSRIGESLVLVAMERALDRGKASWGYVKAILSSWVEKGYKTVDDVTLEAELFSEKRVRKRKSRYSERREVLPDWFVELKREAGEAEDREASNDDWTNDEAERAELRALIDAYA